MSCRDTHAPNISPASNVQRTCGNLLSNFTPFIKLIFGLRPSAWHAQVRLIKMQNLITYIRRNYSFQYIKDARRENRHVWDCKHVKIKIALRTLNLRLKIDKLSLEEEKKPRETMKQYVKNVINAIPRKNVTKIMLLIEFAFENG